MTAQPKKPKAPPPFAEARKACRTITEREQLERVVTARWTSSELREYSRLHFPKNGKDYPTAASYRKALKDIADVYENARISDYASEWRKQFRKGGSKPLPPRREGLLIRGRGQPYRVDHQEYCWYAHTEKYRSLIEQRARDYFKIAPEQPLHVNAWAASQRAYWRELEAKAKAKAPKVPKKPRTRSKLAPQFSRDWVGHTPAFREEVNQRVRDDRRLPPGAHVGSGWWKIACNKYYELSDVPARTRSAR